MENEAVKNEEEQSKQEREIKQTVPSDSTEFITKK